MTDTLHLDEFQAYLLAEDRSPVTIAGYLGDFFSVVRGALSRRIDPHFSDKRSSSQL
jgi:hypothetical protein